MLDESTAAAEAMALCRRASKAPEGAVFVVDADTPVPAVVSAVSGVGTTLFEYQSGQDPAFDPRRLIVRTLPYAVLTGVLRDSLKFRGLVVTDALQMGAIVTKYGAGEAEVRALKEGSVDAGPQADLK